MYEEIVGRGGVSPTHFFYSMTFAECAAFMRGLDRKEKSEWERTRMLMYAVVQVNSRKSLDPEDVLKLPWDDSAKPVEINEEDIKRLREFAKNIRL